LRLAYHLENTMLKLTRALLTLGTLGLAAPVLAADLSDIAKMSWLDGVWRAHAMGGEIEEVYEPAHNDEVISTLTIMVNGAVTRYELRSAHMQDGKIVFHEAGFGVGMQPGNPVPDRALTRADATHASFEGLEQWSTGKNTRTTRITLHNPDGSSRVVTIDYTRVARFSKP
jgi:hypothetical protein